MVNRDKILYELTEEDLINQILIYSIIILLWISSILPYSYLIAITFSVIGILITTLMNVRETKITRRSKNPPPERNKIIKVVIITVFVAIGVTSYLYDNNWLYGITQGFPTFTIGFQSSLNGLLDEIMKYFGYLVIFSIIAELSYAIYIYYLKKFKKVKFSEEEEAEEKKTMWDLLLQDISIRKIIILISLLVVASLFEEIVFRWFMINSFSQIGISLFWAIMISSAIFGYLHKDNGGWFYVLNSTFAGIVFAYIFIGFGFYASWILHLFWNSIVVIQMIIANLMKND